eukprot:5494433-Pyramimonas_sp.AAC.1
MPADARSRRRPAWNARAGAAAAPARYEPTVLTQGAVCQKSAIHRREKPPRAPDGATERSCA